MNSPKTLSPESRNPLAVTRRGFLKQSSCLIAASALGSTAAAAQQPPQTRPAAGLAGGTDGQLFWVVETTSGKVQGIANTGIKEFKGIPYGAPTEGKNRFMPPKKPASWTGVRECFGHGPVSPQTIADLRSDYAMMIQWDHHVGGIGEDCLTLNVWTPGVNDGQKRAVLVSFHGGGFATGSGNSPGYDGAQLAKLGDVVVVTVNHRLASLGYLHLADLGAPPEFAQAGVAGIMDLVASLQWVRDNIERFGGDPQKVMIFGQSGGGAKTTTILATPSAKGLFHCAAVQSGSALRLSTREQATKRAEALLTKLGISKSNIGNLQKISWQQVLAAQSSLDPSVGAFTPVVEGSVLPHHPFDPVAPPESADIPVIVSTTLEDAALRLTNFDLDEAGLKALLNQRYNAKADEIYTLYRSSSWNSKKSHYLIQAQIFTDSGRRNAIAQAERKAALGKAPAYMYLWAYESPAFGGKFGAVHGTDVSASFNNYQDGIGGAGSPQQRALWARFANAWIAFAKTGDPNNPAIPKWPAYDAASRATMIFDHDTRVENDPRGEIRKFWEQMPPAGPLG
ncbi:MAG TPA: carboxylesterase/lipase family protein [Candidatus Angelobacter sp.]|jgi:para-nitrobenzyl esterase|nr:carboxylesterase/lipase family protein [Candidatus Angelobacter sp.]